MKFQLTVTVEVPDHIAKTMPTAPDLQSEFKRIVDRAIESAVEQWAGGADVAVGFDVPSKNEQH